MDDGDRREKKRLCHLPFLMTLLTLFCTLMPEDNWNVCTGKSIVELYTGWGGG